MTVRFLADENFNNRIVLGLRRRDESIDIALVQDVGLRTADDPTVLAWAADADRVLLTHDIATIPDYAHERVTAGLPMPGVEVVARRCLSRRSLRRCCSSRGRASRRSGRTRCTTSRSASLPIHLFPIPDDRHGELPNQHDPVEWHHRQQARCRTNN